jgi:hypothetical protein
LELHVAADREERIGGIFKNYGYFYFLQASSNILVLVRAFVSF